MSMTHKGLKVMAVLLLIGTYLVLQRLASMPKSPTLAPETGQARELFPVEFALPDLRG
jgi:hypothetical protein